MAVNQGSRSTVLVVGDSFVDVLAGPLPNLPTFGTNTVSPEPIAALPGGSALNVACNLQRLRGGTALFTGVGRDAFGEIPRRHCADIGVTLLEATCHDAAAPTGVCVVLSGSGEAADRAFCSHYGVSDAFDVADLLRGGGDGGGGGACVLSSPGWGVCHVHVAGFYSCA